MTWGSKKSEEAHSEYVEMIENITKQALNGLAKGADLTNIVAVARSRHKNAYRHYIKSSRG